MNPPSSLHRPSFSRFRNAREALQFLERRLPFLLDPSSPLSQERLHFAVSMILELYRRQAAVPSGARLGLPPSELRQLLSCLLADCKNVLAASYGGTIPGGHIDITGKRTPHLFLLPVLPGV